MGTIGAIHRDGGYVELRWELAPPGALGSNGFDAITTLSKRAYGYRNLHNLRTAIPPRRPQSTRGWSLGNPLVQGHRLALCPATLLTARAKIHLVGLVRLNTQQVKAELTSGGQLPSVYEVRTFP
jgi:hypothetical protein